MRGELILLSVWTQALTGLLAAVISGVAALGSRRPDNRFSIHVLIDKHSDEITPDKTNYILKAIVVNCKLIYE